MGMKTNPTKFLGTGLPSVDGGITSQYVRGPRIRKKKPHQCDTSHCVRRMQRVTSQTKGKERHIPASSEDGTMVGFYGYSPDDLQLSDSSKIVLSGLTVWSTMIFGLLLVLG